MRRLVLTLTVLGALFAWSALGDTAFAARCRGHRVHHRAHYHGGHYAGHFHHH